MECPICLEQLKVPFRQCATGHTVCSGCINDLKACPTCQAEFTVENPILVKNVLEAIPQFCRYSESGCEDIVEQGGQHEDFCGFRTIDCRACEAKVAANQLLHHYEKDHPKRSIFKNVDSKVTWKTFKSTEDRSDSVPVFVFNKFFFVDVDNDTDDEQLRFELEAIPIGKLIDDYYVRVKFEQGNFNFTYTIKAYSTQADAGQFCMRVPQEALSDFINEEGALSYSFFFFKQPKRLKT